MSSLGIRDSEFSRGGWSTLFWLQRGVRASLSTLKRKQRTPAPATGAAVILSLVQNLQACEPCAVLGGAIFSLVVEALVFL